jgi:hypothetical protein
MITTQTSKLKKFKVWHALLLLLSFSLFLYFAHFYLGHRYEMLSFFENLFIAHLADACLIAVLLGFTYEWFIRNESQEQISDILSEKFIHYQDNIIQSMPTALVDKNTMRDILKDDKLEEILREGLSLKCGDVELGNDIYDGLLKKTLSFKERWFNYRHSVTLTSIEESLENELYFAKYYQAYITLRYQTNLSRTSFKFICVPTLEEYNKSLKDIQYEFRWFFPSISDFPVIDQTVFNVQYMKIDELNLSPQIHKDENGNLTWIFDHPELYKKLGNSVVVEYKYEVKIQKRGHLLTLNVVYPTKGVTVEVDYAATDIHKMNVVDLFVTTNSPSIRYTPNIKNSKKIEIEINEWTFPKGGVTFVWVLKPEMTDEFIKQLTSK